MENSSSTASDRQHPQSGDRHRGKRANPHKRQ
jgi:hypothetical protein